MSEGISIIILESITHKPGSQSYLMNSCPRRREGVIIREFGSLWSNISKTQLLMHRGFTILSNKTQRRPANSVVYHTCSTSSTMVQSE